MEQKPTIDVIIPVWNGERFITRALRSVDWQSYEPREIIVVDDGSTDKTEQEVLAFKTASKIPVTYLKKENAGPNSARNLGIKNSSADYLAFLDADDEWEKTKLADQIKVFQTSDLKDLGAVYCAYSLIDENDTKITDMFTVALDPTYRGNIFKKVLFANKITGSASAVLIKKECFDTVGVFDETLKASEDWDMWIRIAEKYSYDFADKSLVKIRRHPDNFQKKFEYMLVNDIAFFNKWVEKVPPQDIPSRWKWSVASLIFLGLPSFRFFPLAKKTLTPKARKVLFSRYSGMEVFVFIAFIRKGFKLLMSPEKIIHKIKGTHKHV